MVNENCQTMKIHCFRKTTRNYLPKIKLANKARLWHARKAQGRAKILKHAGITNEGLFSHFVNMRYYDLPSEIRYMIEVESN